MKPNNNNTPAFFNGEYLSMDKVFISPFDRGFLLGDSVYEVIPAYGGKLLWGAEHIQRLINGLTAVGIEIPYSAADMLEISTKLLIKDEPFQMVYIQISRGDEQFRKHRFPVTCEPTSLVFSIPTTQPIDADYSGCNAHLQEDLRWKRCNIKSTSLMGNVLAYYELYQNGHANDEALLVRDGLVSEAPSSNVFMAKNKRIYTPPVDNILPGITRDIVISLAKKQKFEVIEEFPSVEQLMSADEVWVTNSYEELKPIVSVDGQAIGKGLPGPIWKSLFNDFQNLK